MGIKQRRSGHAVSWLIAQIVWVTKYRYHVLRGDVQLRCRDLVKQICDSEDVRIIEYRPSQKVSDLVKRLKGRTSRCLQEEFPALAKKYWGRHFWAIGYGVWSTGNITEKIVQVYLEHHRDPSNMDNDTIIPE